MRAVILVLKDDIEGLLDLLPLLVDIGNIAGFLELFGNRHLELREWDRHRLLADSAGILETDDEISHWVGDQHTQLPRRLLNTRDVPLERLLAEADAAQVEITHECARAAALEAAANDPRTELRRALRLDDH